MSLRQKLAITAGKSSRWFLKTFTKGGGSSLPGKIALGIDPDILSEIARDYEVIVVTGTNGKTLTTALIVNILQEAFGYIVTNPTGANLKQGIVATFLDAPKNINNRKFAVLEIDEATLSQVTEYIKPNLVVLTNIFRDQLDRYGEIYTTYNVIKKGLAKAPLAKLILNGDMPLFNDQTLEHEKKYYGFYFDQTGALDPDTSADGIICPKCNHVIKYNYITYSNQGNYYCPNCDFKRPVLDYKLTKLNELTEKSSTFTIDGETYSIPIGGLYNVYNALAAIAVARYYKIEPDIIHKGFKKHQNVFGRQEQITINDKKATIMLVKNPVGLNQVLDTISKAPYDFSLVHLVNDNYADGIDVSWIWDGHYEKLQKLNIPYVITGGKRERDITLRLKVAGFEDRIQTSKNNEDLLEFIQNAPTKHIYILATYTAMMELRKLLNEKGYLGGGK